MSFAFASYNKYGIVVSADRCITGTSQIGEKFTATSSARKLFLTSQGYAITFTGCSSVDGTPVPVKISEVLDNLSGNLTVTDLFTQFVSEMAKFTSENIIFIIAGYENGEPLLLSATTTDTENVTFNGTCFSGEIDLGKKIIDAVLVTHDSMTLQDRMDFHRFITYSIAKLQSYSNKIQTVSEECDIVAIGPKGVLFSEFNELH